MATPQEFFGGGKVVRQQPQQQPQAVPQQAAPQAQKLSPQEFFGGGKVVRQTQEPAQQISIDVKRGEDVDKWHEEQTNKLMSAYQSGQISAEKLHEINNQLTQEAKGALDREKPMLLKMADAAGERIEKGKEADVAGQRGEQSFLESGYQITGQMAGFFGDVGAIAAGEMIPDAIKEKGDQAVESFMKTDTGKTVAEKAQEVQRWSEENPRAARNLIATGNIASIIPITGGGGAGVKAAKEVGETGLDVAELGVRAGLKTADVAGEAGGGILRRGGQFGGKLAGEVTSKATGLEKDTVRRIIKNPEMFSSSEMAKISDQALFDKARTAIDNRLEDLSDTGKAYSKIRGMDKRVNLGDDVVEKTIREAGFEIKDGKIIPTTTSVSREPADINALQRIYNTWGGKTELSADEFLNLRKDLGNLGYKSLASEKTQASKNLSKKMRATLNEYRGQLPGLKELDAKFAPEKELMEKVKKDFFNRDGTLKSNALSKMTNLTGRGKEQVLDRMEKIVPGITEEVNILKAVKDISRAGEQKVGTYGQSLLGVGAGAATGGVTGAIMGAIATSPAVTVRILRAYAAASGKAKGMISKIISKMKKGSELTKKQKSTLRNALDFAEEKLVRDGDFEPRSGLLRRAKEGKISAGMSIRDVSGGGMLRRDLAQEAKKYNSAEEFMRSDFQKRVIAGQDLGDEIGKKVNPDGTITLYHGTSKSARDKIEKTGEFNDQAYFSVRKSGTEFGDSPLDVAKRKFGKKADVMEIKVDARELESAAAGSEVFSPKRLIKGEDGVWRAEGVPDNSQLKEIYNKATK